MFAKMMESPKIIPILYVLSAVIILLYHCIFTHDVSGIAYSLCMPLFLLISPVVYKIFRLTPVTRLTNDVLIYAFLAFGIGVALHKFRDWDPYYDKAVHVVAGYFFAMIGICAFYYMKREKTIDPYNDLPTALVLSVTFSVTIGVIWEIMEFVLNLINHSDPQRVADTGVTDTMLDLIADLGGAILAAYFLWLFLKKGKTVGPMVKTFAEFCKSNIFG